MAKTKEELNTLKTEFESLTTKLKELTDEELNMVAGGANPFMYIREAKMGAQPAKAGVDIIGAIATVKPDDLVKLEIKTDAAQAQHYTRENN